MKLTTFEKAQLKNALIAAALVGLLIFLTVWANQASAADLARDTQPVQLVLDEEVEIRGTAEGITMKLHELGDICPGWPLPTAPGCPPQ